VGMWSRAVAVKRRRRCERSECLSTYPSASEPRLWVTWFFQVIHKKGRLTTGFIYRYIQVYSMQDSLCVNARQFMRKKRSYSKTVYAWITFLFTGL
jgi:hypothetical protein